MIFLKNGSGSIFKHFSVNWTTSTNNDITNGLSLSYHQFNENKRFITSNLSTTINHQTLFTDQKFVSLELGISARMTLKNYTTISIRTNFNPYEKNDFYEARTNDLAHPLKRSKSINGSGWISTDYRKKIAIDIGGGGAINPLYKN